MILIGSNDSRLFVRVFTVLTKFASYFLVQNLNKTKVKQIFTFFAPCAYKIAINVF